MTARRPESETKRSTLTALITAAALAGCAPVPETAPPDGGSASDAGTGFDGGSAPDPACPADGCLRAVEPSGSITRAELSGLVDPGVTIDNGYRLWRIAFATSGREARAVIVVPDTAAPTGGFHVAVNAPGTVGLGDPCALVPTVGGAGLAGFFGARGMVGVSLDYPGIGTPGPHPYLVAEVEGRALLDAARAALDLLALEAVPASGRVAFAGLSQGGHATLAAAARHASYAPELDARAFAVAGPAAVFPSHFSGGIDLPGPHLVFHALLTRAWMLQYGHEGPSPWAVDLASEVDELFETRCLVSFDGDTLGERLGTEPAGVFAADYRAAFAGEDFAQWPFLSEGFAANAIGPYAQTAPLRIYQGTLDDVVLAAFTEDLVRVLRAGGVTVDYVVDDDGGHTDVAFSFLADAQRRGDEAVAWIRARLED